MLVFFSPHQQNLTHLYFKFLRVGGGSLSGTPDQAYSRCVISEDAYRPLLGSGAHTGSTAYSVSQIPKRSGENKVLFPCFVLLKKFKINYNSLKCTGFSKSRNNDQF